MGPDLSGNALIEGLDRGYRCSMEVILWYDSVLKYLTSFQPKPGNPKPSAFRRIIPNLGFQRFVGVI